MNKPYFKSLDGLRAVAVAIVMAGHAGLPFPRSGGVGVDIFFVLSGFLITSILSNEYRRFGKIQLKNFYIRRFLRLAPALLLTTLFFAVIYYFQQDRLPLKIMAIALSYTANWARAIFHVEMGAMDHCWSLAIEEQYYLIWPMVVLALEKNFQQSETKALVLLALTGLLAFYRLVMVHFVDSARIYFALDTHMDGLVLGSALAYVLQAVQQEKVANWFYSRYLGVLVVPVLIVGLLIMMNYITWASPWMGRFGFIFAAFVAATIIADLILGTHSLLRKPLSSAPLVYLGKISYGLYLLHYPIYSAVNSLLPNTNFGLVFAIKIMLSILAASLSFYYYEQPFLRLKQRFER